MGSSRISQPGDPCLCLPKFHHQPSLICLLLWTWNPVHTHELHGAVSLPSLPPSSLSPALLPTYRSYITHTC